MAYLVMNWQLQLPTLLQLMESESIMFEVINQLFEEKKEAVLYINNQIKKAYKQNQQLTPSKLIYILYDSKNYFADQEELIQIFIDLFESNYKEKNEQFVLDFITNLKQFLINYVSGSQVVTSNTYLYTNELTTTQYSNQQNELTYSQCQSYNPEILKMLVQNGTQSMYNKLNSINSSKLRYSTLRKSQELNAQEQIQQLQFSNEQQQHQLEIYQQLTLNIQNIKAKFRLQNILIKKHSQKVKSFKQQHKILAQKLTQKQLHYLQLRKVHSKLYQQMKSSYTKKKLDLRKYKLTTYKTKTLQFHELLNIKSKDIKLKTQQYQFKFQLYIRMMYLHHQAYLKHFKYTVRNVKLAKHIKQLNTFRYQVFVLKAKNLKLTVLEYKHFKQSMKLSIDQFNRYLHNIICQYNNKIKIHLRLSAKLNELTFKHTQANYYQVHKKTTLYNMVKIKQQQCYKLEQIKNKIQDTKLKQRVKQMVFIFGNLYKLYVEQYKVLQLKLKQLKKQQIQVNIGQLKINKQQINEYRIFVGLNGKECLRHQMVCNKFQLIRRKFCIYQYDFIKRKTMQMQLKYDNQSNQFVDQIRKIDFDQFSYNFMKRKQEQVQQLKLQKAEIMQNEKLRNYCLKLKYDNISNSIQFIYLIINNDKKLLRMQKAQLNRFIDKIDQYQIRKVIIKQKIKFQSYKLSKKQDMRKMFQKAKYINVLKYKYNFAQIKLRVKQCKINQKIFLQQLKQLTSKYNNLLTLQEQKHKLYLKTSFNRKNQTKNNNEKQLFSVIKCKYQLSKQKFSQISYQSMQFKTIKLQFELQKHKYTQLFRKKQSLKYQLNIKMIKNKLHKYILLNRSRVQLKQQFFKIIQYRISSEMSLQIQLKNEEAYNTNTQIITSVSYMQTQYTKQSQFSSQITQYENDQNVFEIQDLDNKLEMFISSHQRNKQQIVKKPTQLKLFDQILSNQQNIISVLVKTLNQIDLEQYNQQFFINMVKTIKIQICPNQQLFETIYDVNQLKEFSSYLLEQAQQYDSNEENIRVNTIFFVFLQLSLIDCKFVFRKGYKLPNIVLQDDILYQAINE